VEASELVTKSHNMRKRMNYRLRQRRLVRCHDRSKEGICSKTTCGQGDYSTDPALVGVRDE
jgi:hypothetical protein